VVTILAVVITAGILGGETVGHAANMLRNQRTLCRTCGMSPSAPKSSRARAATTGISAIRLWPGITSSLSAISVKLVGLAEPLFLLAGS
jgi:hypothetical protein